MTQFHPIQPKAKPNIFISLHELVHCLCYPLLYRMSKHTVSIVMGIRNIQKFQVAPEFRGYPECRGFLEFLPDPVGLEGNSAVDGMKGPFINRRRLIRLGRAWAKMYTAEF